MREMQGVEGNSCTNESREVERGRSREGGTIDSESSSDRGHFADTGASAVGEAGREDPIVGSEEVEAAEGTLVAAGKNEVMGAEGSNWPLPLPLPERDELWDISRDSPEKSTDEVSREKLEK